MEELHTSRGTSERRKLLFLCNTSTVSVNVLNVDKMITNSLLDLFDTVITFLLEL